MESTKTIDTSAERTAMAAALRAQTPDPVRQEIQARRAGVADLRDAMTALRADIARLHDMLATKTIAAAVDRGADIA